MTTESITQLIERYKAELPPRSIAKAREVKADNARSRALVVDNATTGRTYITVPVEAANLTKEDFHLKLAGRLVEAETANLNGAFWSTEDLQFGLSSVALGPLNWLHQERKVVGVLSQAELMPAVAEAAGRSAAGPYIEAEATMWRYLYPEEAKSVEAAAEGGKLFYSMECVAKAVECVGPGGCGQVTPYLDAMRRTEAACEHVRERSAHRRLMDPIFQGAAVIIPPVLPGWAGAHLDVMRKGEELTTAMPEAASLFDGQEEAAAQFTEWMRLGASPR